MRKNRPLIPRSNIAGSWTRGGGEGTDREKKILGYHMTPATKQPKGRCVWSLGLRSSALGTCFAEKLVRRFVPPIWGGDCSILHGTPQSVLHPKFWFLVTLPNFATCRFTSAFNLHTAVFFSLQSFCLLHTGKPTPPPLCALSAEACPARQCPVASEMAWQAQAILGGRGVQTQATAAVAALPPPPPHSARCTLTGAAARGLPLSHARQPAIWRSPHSPPGSAASGLAEPSLTLGWAASDLAGPSLTPLNQGTTDFLLFAC